MTPTPEAILVAKIEAVDAAIAAGRSSPDIARRETADGTTYYTDFSLDIPDPVLRVLLIRILTRHGVTQVPEKKPKPTRVVFRARAVFAEECLLPEVAKLDGIVAEFVLAATERALAGLFQDSPKSLGAKPGPG